MASILRSCHAECQRKCAMLRCFNKSARQNSPCTRKVCEKAAFRASWANFVPNMRCPGSCWASFFTELLLDGSYWARFFAPTGTAPRSRRRRGTLHVASGGSVLHKAVLQPVAAVLDPRVVQFPRYAVSHPFLWARGPLGCCWCAVSPLYARISHRHNKTARRAAGRGWSGRRESNPPLKLGKLPFYR